MENWFPFFQVSRAIQAELDNGGVFERLNSPLVALRDLHFIQFRAPVEGVGEAHGLAVSQSLKKAQIVSYFEFLDRKAFHLNSEGMALTSTNGVAAHKFKLLAVQAAKNELYERDAILAHWYTQTPMRPTSLPPRFFGIVEELNELGLSLLAFKTSLGVVETDLVLLVNKVTGGFVTGSCAGRKHPFGIEKAILEAVINFFFGSYGKITQELLTSFDENGLTTLESHRTFWLYKSQVPDWISKEQRPELRTNLLKPSAQQLAFETRVLSVDPFPVVAVTSSSLLPFKVGLPDESDFAILTDRLQNGYAFHYDQPHPIY